MFWWLLFQSLVEQSCQSKPSVVIAEKIILIFFYTLNNVDIIPLDKPVPIFTSNIAKPVRDDLFFGGKHFWLYPWEFNTWTRKAIPGESKLRPFLNASFLVLFKTFSMTFLKQIYFFTYRGKTLQSQFAESLSSNMCFIVDYPDHI